MKTPRPRAACRWRQLRALPRGSHTARHPPGLCGDCGSRSRAAAAWPSRGAQVPARADRGRSSRGGRPLRDRGSPRRSSSCRAARARRPGRPACHAESRLLRRAASSAACRAARPRSGAARTCPRASPPAERARASRCTSPARQPRRGGEWQQRARTLSDETACGFLRRKDETPLATLNQGQERVKLPPASGRSSTLHIIPPKPAQGYPVPSRRTLTSAILAYARSDVPALRHPACSGHIRRLNGRGNPSPPLIS